MRPLHHNLDALPALYQKRRKLSSSSLLIYTHISEILRKTSKKKKKTRSSHKQPCHSEEQGQRPSKMHPPLIIPHDIVSKKPAPSI